jgi:hypothetical protein
MFRTRFFAAPFFSALAVVILSGCATDRWSNIPANATVASSGNDHLSYTAPSYGRIWVYDATSDRLDYSGPVSINDTVTVDPATNVVAINSHTVADKLNQGDQHRIYFVAAQ